MLDGKLDKPTEARWMVAWRAAAVRERRCDQVLWLASLLSSRHRRDAQQSADASALQVCSLGVPLASRKGRLLDGARRHTPLVHSFLR